MTSTNFALIGVANGVAEYRDRSSNRVSWLKFKSARKSIDGVSCDNYRSEFIENNDVDVNLGSKTATDKIAIRTIVSASSLSKVATKQAILDHADRLKKLANSEYQNGFINVDAQQLNLG